MENNNQRLERAVEQFIAGDDAAFSEIYDLTKKYLFYTILKSVNMQEAEDILQNTYVDIYKNMKNIREVRAFKTWAGIIAQNNISHFYRKSVKYEICGDDELMRIEEDDADLLPEDAMDNKETATLIQSIIQELPFAQRQTIVAFYFNQMSIAEIANAMNIPEGTVKTNLYRGKAKIKQGVLELEKKHGTKLHTVGIATVLFFLFGEEAAACELPKDGLLKVRKYQKPIAQKRIAPIARKVISSMSIIILGGAIITALIVSNKEWIQTQIKEYKASKAILHLLQDEVTIELGSELYIEAEKLVDPLALDINRVTIDANEVNVNRVGAYNCYVNYMEQSKIFTVNVVDTTAPQVTVSNSQIYVLKGQKCRLNNYVESIEDLSGSVEIRLEKSVYETVDSQELDNAKANDLYFYAVGTGITEDVLVIVDQSNNECKIPIEIIVINEPTIAVSENFEEFMSKAAAQEYLNSIIAVDDIDGETKNGLYYDDTSLSEEPGEYLINFFFTDSKNFSTNAIQKIRIIEPVVEVQESDNLLGDKPYWQYGNAVRETSLILQEISIEIDGERMSFQPDVAFNDPRINGHSYYTNSILGTWSNGTETLVLDVGTFWINFNPEDDLNGVTFSIGVIVAHQEVEYEGDTYYLYMTGRGSVFMDTDWLQPKGCYLQEMLEEAFGDLSGWIYY